MKALWIRNIFFVISMVILLLPSCVHSAGDEMADMEMKMAEMVNYARKTEGLSDLKWNPLLSSIARKHADDMKEKNYFSHIDMAGRDIFKKLTENQIPYQTAGENIGYGPSISVIEAALLKSPEHRANILDSEYEEIGIGIATDGKGGLLVVQCFLKRKQESGPVDEAEPALVRSQDR